MTCGYCQFANTEEEHRCRRCGRRLTGSAVAAPQHLAREHVRIAVQALGANALAAQIVEPELKAVTRSTQGERRRPATRAPEVSIDTGATLDALPRARVLPSSQPTLFGAEFQPKIIPFDTLSRGAAAPAMAREATALAPEVAVPLTSPAPVRTPRAPRRQSLSHDRADDPQSTLDFLPPQRNVPRTLKTNAEGVIGCDAKPAAPMHRATAAALDVSVILARVRRGCDHVRGSCQTAAPR